MKSIISINMSEEGEDVSIGCSINEKFPMSPTIAGTMLISLLDCLSLQVPDEQNQEKFEDMTLDFFLRNFKKRYSSEEIDYNKD